MDVTSEAYIGFHTLAMQILKEIYYHRYKLNALQMFNVFSVEQYKYKKAHPRQTEKEYADGFSRHFIHLGIFQFSGIGSLRAVLKGDQNLQEIMNALPPDPVGILNGDDVDGAFTLSGDIHDEVINDATAFYRQNSDWMNEFKVARWALDERYQYTDGTQIGLLECLAYYRLLSASEEYGENRKQYVEQIEAIKRRIPSKKIVTSYVQPRREREERPQDDDFWEEGPQDDDFWEEGREFSSKQEIEDWLDAKIKEINDWK